MDEQVLANRLLLQKRKSVTDKFNALEQKVLLMMQKNGEQLKKCYLMTLKK